MITKSETQKVIKSANFLNDKGYARKIEESTISFLGDRVNFIITFERYSDVSDILIKFVQKNEIYSVGWIACVRSGLSINPHQRLENVLALLSYIRENYSSVTNRDYCKESDLLIKDFIEKERKNKKYD